MDHFADSNNMNLFAWPPFPASGSGSLFLLVWSPGGGYIGVFCKRFSACGFPLSTGSWLGSSRARCFSCMHVFRDIAPSPEADWLLLVSPFCRFRRMKKLHFLEVPSCVYSGVASIAVHFLVFYEYIFIFLGTFFARMRKTRFDPPF